MADTKTPDGSWTLENLHGTREGVLKAIKESKVPEHWKSLLGVEIGALPASFNLVTLNAHFHNHNQIISLHLSLKPATGLV